MWLHLLVKIRLMFSWDISGNHQFSSCFLCNLDSQVRSLYVFYTPQKHQRGIVRDVRDKIINIHWYSVVDQGASWQDAGYPPSSIHLIAE